MILILDSDIEYSINIAESCARGLRDANIEYVPEDIQVFGDVFSAMSFIRFYIDDIDLLIVDVMLEGANAFAVLNELRAHLESMHLPVVLTHDLRYMRQFTKEDLKVYEIEAILDKSEVLPDEFSDLAVKFFTGSTEY